MKNNWAKTLLYIYKYLERVCDGIDNLVNQKALNSFFYCQNRSENEVNYVAKNIIELSERKAKLINIKVLVDSCLIKIDQKLAQLLIERYIDDDSIENIANRQNINVRTFFRRIRQAETSFSCFMLKEGFTEQKLCSYLSEERWIIEVYENFVKEYNENQLG